MDSAQTCPAAGGVREITQRCSSRHPKAHLGGGKKAIFLFAFPLNEEEKGLQRTRWA